MKPSVAYLTGTKTIRFAARALPILILGATAVIVIYIILDQIYWRRVVEKREAFTARFGNVGAPVERPDAEVDAIRYFEYAAMRLSQIDEDFGTGNGEDPLTLLIASPAPLAADDPLRQRILNAQPALDIVLKILDRPDATFAPVYAYGVYMPNVLEMVDFAPYLHARALLAAQDGDAALATTYLTASLRMANLWGSHSNLIWWMIGRMRGIESLRSAQRILPWIAIPSSEANTDAIKKFRRNTLAAALAAETAQSTEFAYEHARLRLPVSFLEMGRLDAALWFDDAMKNASVVARQEALHALGEEVQSLGFLHYLARISMPNLIRSAITYDESLVICDQFEGALALERYRKDHGAYPQSLDALVPTYCDAVPEDAFVERPFVYKPTPDGYMLYSVGWDKVDNQGTEGQDLVWQVNLPNTLQ